MRGRREACGDQTCRGPIVPQTGGPSSPHRAHTGSDVLAATGAFSSRAGGSQFPCRLQIITGAGTAISTAIPDATLPLVTPPDGHGWRSLPSQEAHLSPPEPPSFDS